MTSLRHQIFHHLVDTTLVTHQMSLRISDWVTIKIGTDRLYTGAQV